MMQVTKVWWDGEKLMAEPIDPTTIYQEPAQKPQRWAVFCQGCRKEWSVSYPHTGKDICVDCDDKLAQQDSTCSNTLRAQGKAYPRTCKKCGLGPCIELANKALDKMAENARMLGLDYEPAPPVVWHDAPQTIYLQVCPEADHCEVRFADHDEVTWCQDKIHDSDIAYVRASTTQQPPAQRTWVGLTDEEMREIYKRTDWDMAGGWEYERAIEAKLKEKNT